MLTFPTIQPSFYFKSTLYSRVPLKPYIIIIIIIIIIIVISSSQSSMGTISNNRFKRNASFQSFDHNLNNPHISKKLKSSHNPVSNPITSSPVSRLRLYPQYVSPIVREIQAPCIIIKGFTSKKSHLSMNSSSKIANPSRKSHLFMNSSSEKVNPSKKSDLFMNSSTQILNTAEKADLFMNCMFSKSKKVDYEMEDDDVVEVTDVQTVNDVSGDSGVDEIAMEEDVDKLEEVQAIRDKYRELDVKAEENRSDVNNVDGVPYYKKLLCDSLGRDVQLRRLRFDISLVEEKRGFYKRLYDAKKDEEKEDEDLLIEPFRPLAEDDLELVANALSNSSRRKVLVTHENSNITISGEVLRCLRPGAWLNDEVINLYLELLKEREKKEPKKFLKCHFFNTFFYKKLISGRTGYDYKSVRRWTTQRKLGYSLLECDKIFIPVHKEIHWCLAVINKKEEKFQYLDSLGGVDKQVMRVLAKYVVDEVKDKNGKDIDVSSWQQEYVTDLPNQENGFDCGVFMIKYADFYSRGLGLCFNQEHMPYFRLRTAKEILKLRAD